MEAIFERLSPAFLFFLQLFLAEGIFLVRFPRRRCFPARLIAALLFFTAATWRMTDIYIAGWVLIPPLLIWVLSFLLCRLLFEISWKECLFICISGMAVQHSTLLLMEILLRTFAPAVPYAETLWLSLFLYPLLCGGYYFVFARLLNRRVSIRIKPLSLILSAMVILLFSMCLRMMAVGYLDQMRELTTLRSVVDLYGAGGCTVSLCVLFFSNQVDELKFEQLILERLLRAEAEKYSLSSSLIEALNVRCHDLKHHLERLRLNSQVIPPETIQDLISSVNLYTAAARTGNDALDSILMEEMLCCKREAISFTVVADGSLLSFMSPTDIYAMFSNAIDNAIEAVRGEADPQKRVILLKVFAHQEYVCIHIENYCPGAVCLKNGMPVPPATKDGLHGYGMKSIRYVAQKYGGNLVCRKENDMFHIDVLLEIPEK